MRSPLFLAAGAMLLMATACGYATRARQSCQNGVPFPVHNFGIFGISLRHDVFDFGQCRAAVRERKAQLGHAQENVERLKGEVSVRIEQSYHKVRAELLQAQLTHLPARAELEQTIGRTTGQ